MPSCLTTGTIPQHEKTERPVRGEFNAIFHGVKLFQQCVVVSNLQVKANNLNYIRFHQRKIRVESYTGLADNFTNTVNDKEILARRFIILPSFFQGSPFNRRALYYDATTLISKSERLHFSPR